MNEVILKHIQIGDQTYKIGDDSNKDLPVNAKTVYPVVEIPKTELNWEALPYYSSEIMNVVPNADTNTYYKIPLENFVNHTKFCTNPLKFKPEGTKCCIITLGEGAQVEIEPTEELIDFLNKMCIAIKDAWPCLFLVPTESGYDLVSEWSPFQSGAHTLLHLSDIPEKGQMLELLPGFSIDIAEIVISDFILFDIYTYNSVFVNSSSYLGTVESNGTTLYAYSGYRVDQNYPGPAYIYTHTQLSFDTINNDAFIFYYLYDDGNYASYTDFSTAVSDESVDGAYGILYTPLEFEKEPVAHHFILESPGGSMSSNMSYSYNGDTYPSEDPSYRVVTSILNDTACFTEVPYSTY